jgi:hypothetical protein
MSRARPIPFEQVRIRADGEGARGGGRPPLPPPAQAVFHWGRLLRADATPVPDDVALDVDVGDGVPRPESAAGVKKAPNQPSQAVARLLCADVDDSPQPGSAALSADGHRRASPLEEGASGSGHAGRRSGGAAPVRAIARSVRLATMVNGLVDKVAGFCNGSDSRRHGPWELSLPLDAQGLGRSVLQMRLASADLLLRFVCDGTSTRDWVVEGADRLSAQLHEALDPPLDVRIETELA